MEVNDGDPVLSSSRAILVAVVRVSVEGLRKASEVVGMGHGGRASIPIFGEVDLPRKVLASSALPLKGSGPRKRRKSCSEFSGIVLGENEGLDVKMKKTMEVGDAMVQHGDSRGLACSSLCGHDKFPLPASMTYVEGDHGRNGQQI